MRRGGGLGRGRTVLGKKSGSDGGGAFLTIERRDGTTHPHTLECVGVTADLGRSLPLAREAPPSFDFLHLSFF